MSQIEKQRYQFWCKNGGDHSEGPLSYEECTNVLKSFQNDKSPDEDGFTVEFYKLF